MGDADTEVAERREQGHRVRDPEHQRDLHAGSPPADHRGPGEWSDQHGGDHQAVDTEQPADDEDDRARHRPHQPRPRRPTHAPILAIGTCRRQTRHSGSLNR